jgi:hypothetical protein
MRTQLWIDHEATGPPVAAGINEIRNDTYRGDKPAKGTGLWTSTAGEECSWIEWMKGEGWWPKRDSARLWLLDPDPAARIFEIDQAVDLNELASKFRRSGGPGLADYIAREPRLDWEAIAREYDAVHLTSRGEAQLHIRLDGGPDLYGWDCESTIWFRWRFVGEPREIPLTEAEALYSTASG